MRWMYIKIIYQIILGWAVHHTQSRIHQKNYSAHINTPSPLLACPKDSNKHTFFYFFNVKCYIFFVLPVAKMVFYQIPLSSCIGKRTVKNRKIFIFQKSRGEYICCDCSIIDGQTDRLIDGQTDRLTNWPTPN